jgi:hypothetical protein
MQALGLEAYPLFAVELDALLAAIDMGDCRQNLASRSSSPLLERESILVG